MKKILLSWNSRTNQGIIANDENFKNIVHFIKKGKVQEWIINFHGYDNNESKAFLKNLKDMLKREIIDENFRWEEEEIRFFSQEVQNSPERLLKKLEEIPEHQSGVVMVYEPIDYGYKISEHKDMKLNIHKKIADIFKKRNLVLLLFGNIPYDIHYFEENSPLSEFVWEEYIIKEYEEDELNVLSHLKENVGENIIKYIEGNFELAHGLETFWDEIKLEDRVADLVNNFLEVPLKTNIEKMVYEKLAALSGFLENNKDKVENKINYNGKILINDEKSSELFKAYFDKTALFNAEKSGAFYILEPKPVFEPVIKKSGFIQKKGNIKPLPTLTKTISREFAQIASFFRHNKPIFMLGAGNSLVSGAPDRRMLFQAILAQVYPDEKEEFEKMTYEELKENFQNLINDLPQDDIRKRVIKMLSDLKPSIGHFHLMQLVKSEKIKIKVFITTNFDTLLEDSLMDYGIRSKDFIKLVSKENIDAHEWDWVNEFPEHLKIFKICGDMYYGAWLAVDDEAANNWIESAVEAMANVDDFRTSHFFIILGHKFEEIDLSKIFEKKQKQNLIIVYANPDEKDCREFEKRYKHKCKSLKIIHGDFGKFDNFMQELSSRLRERNMI
jgi:hypothetical protein